MRNVKNQPSEKSRRLVKRLMSVTALSSIMAVGFITISSDPVRAQDANAAPGTPADAGIEAVVVTGTRVVRNGYNAPTPLTVLGTADIEAAARPDLADYLNDLPSVQGSQTPRESANNGSLGLGGINAISLRGLGAKRTLILLDGERTVAAAPTGEVDVSSFPQGLVSRVDVVTGGASAAYGSDAIAGVINFVLDKQYEGIKGELDGTSSTYGDDLGAKLVLTAGTSFAGGRGHFIFNTEVSKSEGVPEYYGARNWKSNGVGAVVNPAWTANSNVPQYLVEPNVGPDQEIPGGIITGGPLMGTAFGKGGVPYQFQYGAISSGIVTSGGDWQTYLPGETESIDPPTERRNIFARVGYDLTDNIAVFAQGSFATDHATNNIAPIWYSGTLTVSATNPFLPATVAARAATLGLTSFPMGLEETDALSYLPGYAQGLAAEEARTTQRVSLGANGSVDVFGNSWKWDAYLQRSETLTSENDFNNPITQNFSNALDSVVSPTTGQIVCRTTLTNPGNGCVPFDPFGTGVNGPATFNYFYGDSHVDQRLIQDTGALSFSGNPLSTWAGPVSVAFGVEWREELGSGWNDPISKVGGYFNANYKPAIGQYNVKEAFAETIVPLAKDEFLAKQLDVDLAGRFTDYSTAGEVETWKVGPTWQVMDGLRFRGSISYDIRAPNLGDLFAGGATSAGGQLLDPFNGNSSSAQSVQIANAGNPNLGLEKTLNKGYGVVLQPTFIPGFSLSADYWDINIKGAIQTISAQQVINECYAGETALCAAVSRPNGVLTVKSIPFNVGVYIVRGIDYEASYDMSLSDVVSDWPGNLAFRALATQYLKDFTRNNITPQIDFVGVNGTGGVPDLSYSISTTYTLNRLMTTLAAHGFSSGVNQPNYIQCAAGSCPISSVNFPTINDNHMAGEVYFDTTFNYLINDNLNAFFNVSNILNMEPPANPRGVGTSDIQINTAPRTNGQLYDQLGRMFHAGVRFNL